MNTDAVKNIEGGIYMLSARDGAYDDGCIISKAMQISEEPARFIVSVSKDSKTCEIIKKTGRFNLTVLTEDVPEETISHFGEETGKEKDKFTDNAIVERSANGIYYLNSYSNSFISAKVMEEKDMGNYILFISDVTDSRIFNNSPSLSYSEYKEKFR